MSAWRVRVRVSPGAARAGLVGPHAGAWIVEEARAEGRSIVRQAAADNERLEADSARIRALLRAALATIDEEDEDEAEAA